MPVGDPPPTPEAFGAWAAAWMAEHLELRQADEGVSGSRMSRHRAIQRRLFDAGLAGITWPVEFGGLGLSPAHEAAFLDAAADYELPHALHITLGILGPTLLRHGTVEQCRTHLPPMLRGEAVWVQLLSEPTGGSDMAGALSRLTNDGLQWVLNGAKTWTTGAQHADFGMCLVRTDFDVPKHRGLSMVIVDLHAPGVTVVPFRQSDGSEHFCEEFFDDVVIPNEAMVGAPGDGWTVAQTLLAIERAAVSSNRGEADAPSPALDLLALARRVGLAGDPAARRLVGEAHVLVRVQAELSRRLGDGMRAGVLPPIAGSLGKLFWSESDARRAAIAMELGGLDVCAWSDPADAQWADAFLVARNLCIGGGTSEIQRNIISERMLGMPREPEADRDLAFSERRSNALARRAP